MMGCSVNWISFCFVLQTQSQCSFIIYNFGQDLCSLLQLNVCLTTRAGMRGRQAWQLPRVQWLIAVFLVSVIFSLCGTYFCDTWRHRGKTDGQILSLDSCPSSSEYDIAKTIDFNDVIDEFESVKARKNVNEFYFMLCLYAVNKLRFWVRRKNCVSRGA
jgi:hypothetical protein